MSFLDNLENNLKSLESQEEQGEDALRQQKARVTQRNAAMASASFADELKKGAFTAELLRQSARAGHRLRTKIHIAWLGSSLRLEARHRRLELRPTPAGVIAVFFESGQELRTAPVDLRGNPVDLLDNWLAGMSAPIAEPPAAD